MYGDIWCSPLQNNLCHNLAKAQCHQDDNNMTPWWIMDGSTIWPLEVCKGFRYADSLGVTNQWKIWPLWVHNGCWYMFLNVFEFRLQVSSLPVGVGAVNWALPVVYLHFSFQYNRLHQSGTGLPWPDSGNVNPHRFVGGLTMQLHESCMGNCDML